MTRKRHLCLKELKMSKLKEVEKSTLDTFTKHRPSEYFSHLSSFDAFEAHNKKVEALYRFGLALPPEFFLGKKIIDLGSGTGENTVSLACWGAKCTLVEMNSDALLIARNVFLQHCNNFYEHQFVNASLYDIDVSSLFESFDFGHSRGVFTHCADKPKAFNILSSLVKPGGYIIYGDRNTCGGIQEMLQRYAIYKLGGLNDDKIIELSEALFSEDIDRSVASVPRTREAIIFDRWVIRQQDDPSVDEVLGFFEENGLEYVSSWPKIDFPGRGSSTYTDPRNTKSLKDGSKLIENLWMILNKGEAENFESFSSSSFCDYSLRLKELSQQLRNLNEHSEIDAKSIMTGFQGLMSLAGMAFSSPKLITRLETFCTEVDIFLKSVNDQKDISTIRGEIDNFEILFKGFAGVRHVDYLAYKPKRPSVHL